MLDLVRIIYQQPARCSRSPFSLPLHTQRVFASTFDRALEESHLHSSGTVTTVGFLHQECRRQTIQVLRSSFKQNES